MPSPKPATTGYSAEPQREERHCAYCGGQEGQQCDLVSWSCRKLKQDRPDADLVEVVGQAAQALDNGPDAGLALEALPELIDQLEARMKEAAKKLDFEEAANLRDRVKQLRQKMARTF